MPSIRAFRILSVLSFLVLGHAASFAADTDPAAAIDELMGEYVRSGDFSGAVLVAGPEGVVFQQAYGLANREWDLPNTLDTRFRIGSLSKQFTAALIMTFVQEGRLSLDDRLGDILPWYRQDTGQRITLRHLLSHSSGLDRRGIVKMIQEAPTQRIPLREEVELYCSGDLESEPGERFAYNNAGYVILSAIVEEIGGAPFAEVFAARIAGPAGLTDTFPADGLAIIARRADGYDRTEDGLRKPPFVDPLLATGAGGLYSTVGDLYRWDQALYGDAILSDAIREQMFTPAPGPYGFGWFIIEEPVGPGGEPRTVITHPGQGDGFWSTVWRLPQDRRTVILINNLGRTDLDAMAYGILAILRGEQPTGPAPAEG